MKALFEAGCALLTERDAWESKQRVFYQMRHDGLPRKSKPFPTAADAHYPEIDMAIRRHKPFWNGQVTAGKRLAEFISLADETNATADAAADFFDFEVTQRSEFFRVLRVVFDTMGLRGRGIIKATVDPFENYALCFQNVDPLFLLVPGEADDLKGADQFVHVRRMTVKQYQFDRRYNQDSGVLELIRGGDEKGFDELFEDKRTREGITHSTDKRTILVWEHYDRTPGGWTVHTYSPQWPDLVLRKPFGVPYKIEGKVSLPFFSFVCEVKDEGWYSPRGFGELLAPLEQYLTKLWNEKADFMTFANRPIYTGDKEMQNTANYRWQPGEYIPGNIRSVQNAPPSMDFNNEMMFVKGIAEQQTQSPDFGIMQGQSTGDTNKPRTAREINQISALQQTGTNDMGLLLRDSLSKLYKHVWGLLCQFRDRDWTYYSVNKLGTLPEEAVHTKYLVQPDGSPDGWNVGQRIQQALFERDAFRGDPNVNQELLTERTLGAFGGRTSKKLFIPTNVKAATEAEDEAQEISILREGFPAAVTAGEDHATRAMIDLGWLQKQNAVGAQLDPIAMQRVQEHLAVHVQYMRKTNPPAYQQFVQQVQMMEQQTMQQGMAQNAGRPGGNGDGQMMAEQAEVRA